MIPLEELFASVLDVPRARVGDDTGPGDGSGWASQQHSELVVAVETRYGVGFSHEEVGELWSLGSVRAALRRKGIRA